MSGLVPQLEVAAKSATGMYGATPYVFVGGFAGVIGVYVLHSLIHKPRYQDIPPPKD